MLFLRSGRIRSAFQGFLSACLLLSTTAAAAGDYGQHGGWGMTLLRPWKPHSQHNCDPQQKPRVKWLMTEKKVDRTNPFIRKAVEYPVTSPHCSPNFGHYQTRWSSFPESAGDPYCSLLSPLQSSSDVENYATEQMAPMPVPAAPGEGLGPDDTADDTEPTDADTEGSDSGPDAMPADDEPVEQPEAVEGASYRPAKLPLLLRNYSAQNRRGVPDAGSSPPVSEVFGLSPIPEMSAIRPKP